MPFKSVYGVCITCIPSLTSNGTTADSAHEKAECLKCLLPNIVSHTSLSVSTLPSHTPLIMVSVSFASEKVEKFLATRDADSATGPDIFGSLVLKTCSAALAHSLSALFTI